MKNKGWEISGVESSKSGAAIGKKVYGIDIFNGSLNEAHYRDNSFDIITMWHVLEHVSEPTEIFQEVKRILKPGGIFLVAVPNIESLEAKVFKENIMNPMIIILCFICFMFCMAYNV